MLYSRSMLFSRQISSRRSTLQLRALELYNVIQQIDVQIRTWTFFIDFDAQICFGRLTRSFSFLILGKVLLARFARIDSPVSSMNRPVSGSGSERPCSPQLASARLFELVWSQQNSKIRKPFRRSRTRIKIIINIKQLFLMYFLFSNLFWELSNIFANPNYHITPPTVDRHQQQHLCFFRKFESAMFPSHPFRPRSN